MKNTPLQYIIEQFYKEINDLKKDQKVFYRQYEALKNNEELEKLKIYIDKLDISEQL